MKFLQTEGENLVFQMGRREKALLSELLKLYPLVPPAHHRIGEATQGSGTDSNQHLLDEALADHRRENRQQIEAMLREPNRIRETSSGFQLLLSRFQVEALLQVLNDIRVGSWLHLGSPDEKRGKRLRLNLQNARYVWAMELAGHIQYVLLSALGQG